MQGILEPPEASKKLYHNHFLRRLEANDEFTRSLEVELRFLPWKADFCGARGRRSLEDAGLLILSHFDQEPGLSDHRYLANCFRMFLHCLANNLLVVLRQGEQREDD